MNYRLLNEVLIEWNESSKEDSDNTFLKSEDIKGSLDRCFIYRLNEKERIKIFDTDWSELEKYKDKVWINSKHVELERNANNSRTVDAFEPGEYKVYIKDIDKVTDMTYMFYDRKQLVSAFIPNSITKIGNEAFKGCTALTSVSISNSVTSIGSSAFSGCSGLTSIAIPDSVTAIGAGAFCRCSGLTSVRIPNSVTSIGREAFYNCTGLTSVTIPSSVTSIGVYAFLYCNNLKTVYVEDISRFNQIEFKSESADPRCYGAKLIELKK